MTRWLAYSQPFAVYRYGPEWLPYRVRVADDVAVKWRRRMWTRKGKR